MNEHLFEAYPRGFYGQPITNINAIERNAFVDRVNSLKMVTNAFKIKAPSKSGHLEIEALYVQMLNNSPFINSFEFHEQVIQVALKAFGTDSLMEWYYVNESADHLTQRHYDFIEDTLLFINTGKRKMFVDLWETLLNNKAPGSPWPKNKEDIQSFVKTHEINRISDLIILWCQKENGVYDLIRSLHVLFGK